MLSQLSPDALASTTISPMDLLLSKVSALSQAYGSSLNDHDYAMWAEFNEIDFAHIHVCQHFFRDPDLEAMMKEHNRK